MPQSILRLPAVQARTGLSRSTIYLRISEGSFPRQVSLGARAVGWIEDEIDAHVENVIKESRKSLPEAAGEPENGQENG